MATNDDLRPVLARPPLPEYLRELWTRRDFMRLVPSNHLRAANLNTALGNLWFLLNPILQIAIYFLLFGLLIDADRGIDNYLAYLTIGVLSFNLVSQSFLGASRCIPVNLTLIRSLYFPRATIPITALLSSVFAFGPALLVMVTCTVLTGASPTLRLLLLPVVLAMFLLILLGFVMAIARIGSYFRDLHSLLPHLVRMLFYGSGILFDPTSFTSHPVVLLVFRVNPFYEILELMRWCIMARPVHPGIWLGAATWAVLSSIIGFVFFWRGEISYGSS